MPHIFSESAVSDRLGFDIGMSSLQLSEISKPSTTTQGVWLLFFAAAPQTVS